MTDIFESRRHLSSSSSSSTITFVSPNDNDELHQRLTNLNNDNLISIPTYCPVALYRRNTEIQEVEEEEEEEEEEVGGGGDFGFERERKKREREEGDQLSLLAVLVTVFRKSLISCRSVGGVEEQLSSAAMEISWPTNVRHVAHVTFDRFNGFLGLPVEFEPEVPRRPPSASTRVFGVSTESMQLSFDSRGNSVPTILLMMQRRLYTRGGLQAEGIFRINAENGQEEHVREQLNRGIVPEDVDVHCLAGLIKAWFRELPTGLLDTLPPDQVMQAQTEDECSHLVRLLPPTEAALLDWAINLMADIAQFEHLNKMNARNIAMVFAPNMTQMADPLTALMYAVQVMNFLKTLIEKTMKDREDSILDVAAALNLEPSDENGHHRGGAPQQSSTTREENEGNNLQDEELTTLLPSSSTTDDDDDGDEDEDEDEDDELHSKIRDQTECILLLPPPEEKENIVNYYCPPPAAAAAHDYSTGNNNRDGCEEEEEGSSSSRRRRNIMVAAAGGRFQSKSRRTKTGQSSSNNNNIPNCLKKATASSKKAIVDMQIIHMAGNGEKSKEISIISRLNSQAERVEAWR